MSKPDRTSRLRELETWADAVRGEELIEVDTTALQTVMNLAEQRAMVEAELVAAVAAARTRGHSWSQIGAMLGVSKQAARRKYGSCAPAA